MDDLAPTEQTAPIPSATVMSTTSSSPIPLIVVSFLAGVGIAAAGFFGYQYFQVKKQIAVPPLPPANAQPSAQPVTQTTSVSDDWKTYTNSEYSYSFKLPSHFSQKDLKNPQYVSKTYPHVSLSILPDNSIGFQCIKQIQETSVTFNGRSQPIEVLQGLTKGESEDCETDTSDEIRLIANIQASDPKNPIGLILMTVSQQELSASEAVKLFSQILSTIEFNQN